MQNTTKKLDEAIYFLNRAEECEANKDTNGLQNNLQAFIWAGRSVRSVLESDIKNISRSYRNNGEIKKQVELEQWHQEKEGEFNRDKLCDFFKVGRNYTLKQGSIKINLSLDLAEEIINISDQVTVTRYDKAGQLIKITSSAPLLVEENINEVSNARRHWTFEEWQGGEDVFTLCQRYVDKLVSVLKEANEVFNNL